MVTRGCAALFLLALAWSAQAEIAVWAEASLSHDRAYVQETLLYTLSIYSAGNLQRITVTPPHHARIALEKLDGPRTRADEVGGKRYILNEFRYALTPLVSGSLTLEPAEITIEAQSVSDYQPSPVGALATPGLPAKGSDSEVVELTSEEVYLVVFPPFREAEPWLPLRSLSLDARWSEVQVPQAGEPLELTLTITAAGSMGSRIPSLMPQLGSADISVYAVEVNTGWAIEENSNELIGRRVETYTVVPRREGTLTLPALRVPWWDATGNQRAVAELPAQILRVGADPKATALKVQSRRSDEAPRISWQRALVNVVLPVAGSLAFALLAGWWVATERSVSTPRRQSLLALEQGQSKKTWSRAVGKPTGLASERQSISGPLPDARARASRRGRRGIPGPARLHLALLWFWFRIRWQSDEVAIVGLLRKFAAANLGLSANTPLRRIAKSLAAPPLGLDEQRLGGLFERLEAAIYGKRVIALAPWKRELQRCLAPFRANRSRRRKPAPQSEWPALNP